MAPNVFERPFQELTAEDVRTFLEGVSGEGMFWEAKGTLELQQLKAKIREAVCGLANQLGGYLIIGADQLEDGSWTLSGVPRGGLAEEPHDWISRVIVGGLHNSPPFDVRVLPMPSDRLVAVVQVEPVADPPTMTTGGIVWQRVNIETKKVTDPRVLADLIRRGEAARTRSEGLALENLRQATDFNPLVGIPYEHESVVLAFAPVAMLPDLGSRLFTPVFRQTLEIAAKGLHVGELMSPIARDTRIGQSRDGWTAYKGSLAEDVEPEPEEWGLRAGWDSCVTVQYSVSRNKRSRWDLGEIIRMAWYAASMVVPTVTGVRDAKRVPVHLALAVRAQGLLLSGHSGAATGARPLQRWTEARAPNEDEFASINRELLRSAGVQGPQVWEL